ncbi:OmpA family protein [Aminobacter sp. Piv2-1]|uniref:OmpA family protein n=1 Tax=Aminobacter sp. Piv2-1 TaxID=3031122 RepID=UPI0030ABB3CF
MKRQSRILAGTAIGLFMASAPLGAMPMVVETAASGRALPLIRVQVECQEGESAEACAARGAQEAAPEQPRRKKRQAEEQQQQEQAAPEAEPQPQQAEEPQPRRKQKRQVEEQQQQAAPEAEPQPQQAEEPQPRRKQKRQVEEQQQQEQAAPEAEPQPQQAEEPQPSRKQKRKIEEQQQEQPAIQAEPQPQQAEEPQPSRKQKRKIEEQQQEQPAIQAEPQPQQAEEPAKQAEEPAKQGEEPPKKRKLRAQEQTPAEQAEKPAEATLEKAPLPATTETPAGEAPAQAEKPAEGEQKPVQQGEAPVNPNEAPLLDSQKEAPPPAQAGSEQPAQEGKPLRKLKPGQQPAQQEQPAEQTAQPLPAPVDLGPPPTDDRQAQEAAQPVEIKPVTAEQGTRLERAPEIDLRRRPRPEGTEVVREIGDRLIVEINNQIIVESNDRPRLTRNAQDVYYEELPGGRTREVIIRDNGNQIITIRNRYGDIVRRSRITPDGREYVLTYVDDRYYEEMDEWRDPGLDLPPLELHIPRDEYILEAEYVDDPEAYYDFLEQPPVERVKRLYSVDEVKRSARVRDIARRIDLDTLTFEFGSASIPESEIAKLEGVANAMERMLKKNPAETFLIEGHTDAVGSDVANLALSDRRAEAVADALTNVFGIPPENLSTQGYGERYLKVKTQAPERDNRRVAIRRITPLVAPIASAN